MLLYADKSSTRELQNSFNIAITIVSDVVRAMFDTLDVADCFGREQDNQLDWCFKFGKAEVFVLTIEDEDGTPFLASLLTGDFIDSLTVKSKGNVANLRLDIQSFVESQLNSRQFRNLLIKQGD